MRNLGYNSLIQHHPPPLLVPLGGHFSQRYWDSPQPYVIRYQIFIFDDLAITLRVHIEVRKLTAVIQLSFTWN